MNEKDAIAIHHAIHSGASSVVVRGQAFPIVQAKNGCRSVIVFGHKFMEQNPKKKTQYAKEAREGHQLTWILTAGRGWGLIKDGVVVRTCSAIIDDNIPMINHNQNTQNDEIISDSRKQNISNQEETSLQNNTNSQETIAQRPQKRIKVEPKYSHSPVEGPDDHNHSTTSNEKTKLYLSNDSSDTIVLEYPENTIPIKDEEKNISLQKCVQIDDQKNKLCNLGVESKRHPINLAQPTSPQFDNSKADTSVNSQCDKSKEFKNIIPIWQIDFSELTLKEKLGFGAFGEVRKATYRGTEVAVKILHSQDEENLKMFYKEAELLCKLRHPNIIQCLGACVQIPNLCIVMELAHSNLTQLIKTGPLELKLLIKIALGIVRGINFLHTSKPKIIHRDLKPDNILLDSALCPKIADFGVSREKFGATVTMTRIGTPSYCAPEILSNKKYSEKVDIFSFGMILYSMLTGGPPFRGSGPCGQNLQPLQIMMKIAVKKERPPLPQTIPELAQLITDCWSHNPKDRPTAQELLTRLTVLQEQHAE